MLLIVAAAFLIALNTGHGEREAKASASPLYYRESRPDTHESFMVTCHSSDSPFA